MSRRMDRVNGLLRDEISQVIVEQLRDPRLSAVVSITYVDTSVDLKHARVFVSVLGGQEGKALTMEALKSAAGFVQRELRRKVHLRHIPEISFLLDDSIEKSEALYKLIREGISNTDA